MVGDAHLSVVGQGVDVDGQPFAVEEVFDLADGSWSSEEVCFHAVCAIACVCQGADCRRIFNLACIGEPELEFGGLGFDFFYSSEKFRAEVAEDDDSSESSENICDGVADGNDVQLLGEAVRGQAHFSDGLGADAEKGRACLRA